MTCIVATRKFDFANLKCKVRSIDHIGAYLSGKVHIKIAKPIIISTVNRSAHQRTHKCGSTTHPNIKYLLITAKHKGTRHRNLSEAIRTGTAFAIKAIVASFRMPSNGPHRLHSLRPAYNYNLSAKIRVREWC